MPQHHQQDVSRGRVLQVLVAHGVDCIELDDLGPDVYVLSTSDEVDVQSLPDRVRRRIVFRLSSKFEIEASEFFS